MSRLKRDRGQRRSAPVAEVSHTAGSAAYVSVFCDGTSTTKHEKWRIASFYAALHEGAITWQLTTTGYYDPAANHLLPVSGQVAQWLVNNRWIDQTEHDRSIFQDEGFRVRWRFKCQRCRLVRVIAHPSSLYPSFTLLAKFDFPEVELSHLLHAEGNADATNGN